MSIFNDISDFSYQFDLPTRELKVLSIPIDKFRTAAFHDERILEHSQGETLIPLTAIEQWYESVDLNEPRYIFHHAFTMSTLLGRIMDIPDVTVSYREPLLLTELAAIASFNPDVFESPRGQQVLEVLLSTLKRTDSEVAIPIIKACDSVTSFADTLFEIQPKAKGIMMYSDLSTFMVSCLKVPGRRDFARSRAEIFHIFRPDILGKTEITQLDDHYAVAFLWYAQLREFRHLHQKFGERLTPMFCEDLLTHPEDIAKTLSIWSEIPEGRILASIRNQTRESTHSKSGRKYGRAERNEELLRQKNHFRNEIAESQLWLENVTKCSWSTEGTDLF